MDRGVGVGVWTCSRTCSMLNRIVGCNTGSILWLINTHRDIQYCIQSYPALYVYMYTKVECAKRRGCSMSPPIIQARYWRTRAY